MRRLATIFRSEFLLVVLAAYCRSAVASAVLLYNAEIDARALENERDAGATARSVMVAIDRDVAAATVLAETLATSQSCSRVTSPDFTCVPAMLFSAAASAATWS